MIQFLLLLVFLLSACSSPRILLPPEPISPDTPVGSEPGGEAPSLPRPLPGQPSDDASVREPVYLDSAQILALESYPPQFRLQIKGSLPTPCHHLRVEVPPVEAPGVIDVQVFSVADPDTVCIQVLEPFDESIPLEGVPPGTSMVSVNGEIIGQIEMPGGEGARSMKGYELYAWLANGVWRFSLHVGTNREKTLDEVTDPSRTLSSLAELKDELAALGEGEYVTLLLMPSANAGQLPGMDWLEEISEYCESRGLICQLNTP